MRPARPSRRKRLQDLSSPRTKKAVLAEYGHFFKEDHLVRRRELVEIRDEGLCPVEEKASPLYLLNQRSSSDSSTSREDANVLLQVLEETFRNQPRFRSIGTFVLYILKEAVVTKNGETFRDLFLVLVEKEESLRKEIHAFQKLEEQLKRNLMQKQAILEKTTQKWQKAMLASTFRLWQKTCSNMKKQREIISSCFSKLSRSTVKRIFASWAKYAQISKNERILREIREMNAKHTVLEHQKRDLDSLIAKKSSEIAVVERDIRQIQNMTKALNLELAENKDEIAPYLEKQASVQKLTEGWVSLSLNLAESEMDFLYEQLQEEETRDFVDIELLLEKKNENTQTDALLEMCGEELIFAWLKFHLPGEVQNLGPCFGNEETLSKLFDKLNTGFVQNRDHISMDRILRQEVTFCDLADLFCNNPGLERKENSECTNCLELIRSVKKEIYDLKEIVKASSVYSLRDQTRVESLISNLEETRSQARWVLRERHQKREVWRTLQNRIQEHAWSLLMNRCRGEPNSLINLTGQILKLNDFQSDFHLKAAVANNFGLLKCIFEKYNAFSFSELDKFNHLHRHGMLCLCHDAGLMSLLQMNHICNIISHFTTDVWLSPSQFVGCLSELATRIDQSFEQFVQTKLASLEDGNDATPKMIIRKHIWETGLHQALIENGAFSFIKENFSAHAASGCAGWTCMRFEDLRAALTALNLVNRPPMTEKEFKQTLRALKLDTSASIAFLEDYIELITALTFFLSGKPLNPSQPQSCAETIKQLLNAP